MQAVHGTECDRSAGPPAAAPSTLRVSVVNGTAGGAGRTPVDHRASDVAKALNTADFTLTVGSDWRTGLDFGKTAPKAGSVPSTANVLNGADDTKCMPVYWPYVYPGKQAAPGRYASAAAVSAADAVTAGRRLAITRRASERGLVTKP